MREYVEKFLGEIPDEMDGTATTPAASHLFQMQGDAIVLENKKRDFLHPTVAKLLFLCKCGRPDIQTAVAFLCTRVLEPTSDDESKLTRVIQYLRGTKDLTLRLQADNLNIVKWWVDGAFAVHEGMKSHTGGVMLSARSRSVRSLVPRRYRITRVSLFSSSLVGSHTLLHRKATAVCMSGRPRLHRKRSFATVV